MRRARETGRSARMVLLLMASHRSHRAPLESQEKNLHEMTSQGVVSERVRDMYAQEIEACYPESGQIARGLQFLDCLKRHARSQEDAVAAVLVPGCRTWRHLQNWPRRCKRPKRHGFSFATRTAPISDQLQTKLRG
jgi:hypothetical protein